MKTKLLVFAFAATFLKSVFIPQFASAQNSRVWATYYGGSEADEGYSVTRDAFGNVYLAGTTASLSGIALGGFQDTLYGKTDAFLVKFDAAGNRLWATYYGGDTNTNNGTGVATDASGNVYLAGTTSCYTRIASGGFQDTLAGSQNAFLVKFDANGNRMWATYYGGTTNTYGNAIATDASGNVYLAGTTSDTLGIASGGFHNSFGGGISDAFLVKFNTNGNRLWATYYGGADEDLGFSVASDATGNVYLAGTTHSSDSIASGGFQDTLDINGGDAFLVKFDSNGDRLWATYYGKTTNIEAPNGVGTDASGNVFLTGNTTSSSGIALAGFQNTFGGGSNDAFLVKFNGFGNRIWATYYGGPGADYGNGVASDVAGNVWLAGLTNSTSGIASGGFQNSFAGPDSVSGFGLFLVKFDAYGNRQCATYYELKSEKSYMPITSLTLDTAGNVYMGSSTSFSTGIASGGFQNTFGGGMDADLIKFTSCTTIPIANFQSSDTTFCATNCINYTDLSTNATSWQWKFPGGTPSSSTIKNPQGICYDTAGTFNAKLIVSGGGGTDTLTFINFIKVLPAPPTPVIKQHYDTLYFSTDPTNTSYQWYDNTTLIPGATDTLLIVTHGGNYNVAVHNEFGCQISVGINIVLGIQNYDVSNLFSLSPNPANQSIVISLQSAVNPVGWTSNGVNKKIEITIIDVLGQEVLSFPHLLWRGAGGEALDISKLPAGMYFLQMKTESEIDTKRFVKE